MKSIQCALCGKNQRIVVLYDDTLKEQKINFRTFSARRVPDRMHCRLVKCLNCGLIFSNPIIEEEKINSLYFQSDFNYNQEAEYLKKTYYFYFNKFIKPKNKTIKILEIGCGNGFFLEELMMHGYKNIFGIEPGVKSVSKSKANIKSKIKIDILRNGIFRQASFDIICCFHTLDHVIDPNKFISIVYSMLKQNGKIFFIVHNTNALSVKILGERSPIFDVEHIYLFNNKNLKQIFERNQFEKSLVFNIKNIYPIRYWLRLLPLPIFLKKILIALMSFLRISKLPISLNAGNIGIISSK